MEYRCAIITPTYDRVPELERAIDSVDAQSFKEWRHYIVNDGCPKTKKYLKKRAKHDKHIISGQRVIIDLPVNHNDLGVFPLNEGIKTSTEPYYCVLADDNFFLPHHVNVLYQCLERNKDVYDFVYGNTVLKHKTIPEFYLIRCSPSPRWNHIDLGEPLYKRELWVKHGPYKYEDDPDAGADGDPRAAGKYSYDWHFIRKCLIGGAHSYHINGTPSLVWFMDDKHFTAEKFAHTKLLLTAMPAGNGGVANYRVMGPLNLIHSKGEADLKYWDPAMNWASTDALMAMSDVLVFQGMASDDIADRIEEMKRLGKVCIVEADDNSFALDFDNPKYQELGVNEVGLKFKDKQAAINAICLFIEGMKTGHVESPHLIQQLADIEKSEGPGYSFTVYKDGYNGFSISRNVKALEAIGKCYRAADAITCTTERLAEQLRMFNPDVFVLPNCLDTEEKWRSDLKLAGDGKTRIFWSGGHSHFMDLLPYRDALIEICEEHPEAVVCLMGFAPPAFLRGFKPEQIETYPWADIMEHPYRVHRARPDIGIIPLRQSDFADCKSPIKYLELAALGVPCVVSDSIVYNTVVEDEENGLLFRTVEGFKCAINSLIKNSSLRTAIGTKARRTAEAYDINRRHAEWLSLYEYLWLKKNFGNPTGNTLYPHLLEKWEKSAGQKISSRKTLDAVWDSRVTTEALPVGMATLHGVVQLAAR
jgi:glycosyltransferase involved in cell wall biosynthesis